MIQLINRVCKKTFILYWPVAILIELTTPYRNAEALALLLLAIPLCLWVVTIHDMINHARTKPGPPYVDPAYKDAGINGPGSITKYP